MKPRIVFEGACKRYGHENTNGAGYQLYPIDLTIAQGEVVGCIGNNGSGKSTLLKLAAGITNPSDGYVELNGEVRAMLELGAGLHHELTGIENIQLLSSIHGFSKHRTMELMDQIQSFSGLSSQTLSSKIKTYSTGMNLRLAFSTVIHLDADVLLLDEVFAVGDLKFQNQCVARLFDLKAKGTAMMIAGHNLDIIASISDRAICLSKGNVQFLGSPAEAVAHYKSQIS